jgi:tRNA dimethylallyltransferase
MNGRTLHVLTGCTATGKTDLALAWAERRGAEIVSCDSLLFYRGMDIGTAKPSAADRARVPHHLVDILEPSERMDVRRYVEMARAVIAEIEARGHPVLVVGGSGFYLRSFFAPVADDVAVDESVRTDLERSLERDGLGALVARLAAINPGGLGDLDTRNPRRVVRALERCIASGLPLDELRRRFAAQAAPFADHEVRLLEVTRPEDELRERIVARTRLMLDAGLVAEVHGLRERGFEGNPAASRAIGYRETLAWMAQGAGSTKALAREIERNTWALVRKQRTWFRTQLPEHRRVDAGAVTRAGVTGLFDGEG